MAAGTDELLGSVTFERYCHSEGIAQVICSCCYEDVIQQKGQAVSNNQQLKNFLSRWSGNAPLNALCFMLILIFVCFIEKFPLPWYVRC